MPKIKSDKAILATVREVIKDTDAKLKVKNPAMGGTDKLDPELAFELIRDVVNNVDSPLARDYRMTKAGKTVKPHLTPR